jgi:catechol 2,3-dioxygenase-like lactoylglutathione lyase family enzyme
MKYLTTAILWLISFPGLAQEPHPEKGETSFARTTLVARYSDLAPSITFWRDVMGFTYGGDPEPRKGSGNEYLGWTEEATTYFTSFSSPGGSTLAMLMIEDQPGFQAIDLPDTATAYGGMVLVHTARNLEAVYERAVEHGIEILKPYGPSGTGRSMQVFFRAPTGHVVEIYEMID